MRTLYIDIETSPNLAWSFETFKANIGPKQIVEPVRMLCFAAMWGDERRPGFYPGRDHPEGNDGDMVAQAWSLLNLADVVVHYNGITFDVPHLNREFVEQGYGPPAPYKQIDLIQTHRRIFRHPSNKLEYTSEWLGLAGKVPHEGLELWLKVMAGDPAAWKRFERYNKRDVTLLRDKHHELLPWIPGLPNAALYAETPEGLVCPRCAGTNLIKEGYDYTQTGKYQRYSCKDCGGWSRSAKRIAHADLRNVAL